MPRLFALVAREAVDLRFSMEQAPEHFSARGENNPDGWGLGWFTVEGQPEVRKHALPARGEIPEGQAEAEGCASLFVAQVRRSSRAPRAEANTHPFSAGGWLFAHSGALYPLLETKVRRETGRISHEGHTDSEAFFRLLLHYLESREPLEAIRMAVKLAVDDGQMSGLNFLLARPGELYAFRYAARSASYFSLFWQRRDPGAPLQATSPDTRAAVRSNDLARVPAVLVCSEQFGGTWQPLELGDLLIIHAGLETETVRLVESGAGL
jgi:predicted glutamine amidotransferase